MWFRDTKWANNVGKIVPIYLLEAELSQTLNTIPIKSTKNNNIKHKEGMSSEDRFLFLPFYYKEAAEWNEKWAYEKLFSFKL